MNWHARSGFVPLLLADVLFAAADEHVYSGPALPRVLSSPKLLCDDPEFPKRSPGS
jgi:hypothetical protein